MFLKHKPSDETDLLITHINENQHHYTWTANTCMLQKHHKDYDSQKCDGGEELVQLKGDGIAHLGTADDNENFAPAKK